MRLLSVIVPAYNEERRIGPSIEKIDKWISACGFPVEVKIIVERGADDTLRVAASAASTAVNSRAFEVVDNIVHRGKGYAVRSGMLMSSGDVKLFMDADLSVPLGEINKGVAFFSSEDAPDLLIGTRYENGVILKKQPVSRRIGSRGYNLLLRGLGLTGIKDTQCGFKFFGERGGDVFKESVIDGFGFDIEVLILANNRGLKIKQMPVEWRDSDQSKFRPLADGLQVLADALRVRFRMARRR